MGVFGYDFSIVEVTSAGSDEIPLSELPPQQQGNRPTVILFLEHSGPILLVGVILEAIFGSMLVRTGRGVWLWPMIGVLLLTLGGVLIERWIETPQEQVAGALYGAASALEQNDVDRLFEYISPSARYTPQRARSVLQQYRFQQARITHLEIEINQLTSPPTAVAHLVGWISIEDTQGQPFYAGRVTLEVQLRWEKDRWRITGHQEQELRSDW